MKIQRLVLLATFFLSCSGVDFYVAYAGRPNHHSSMGTASVDIPNTIKLTLKNAGKSIVVRCGADAQATMCVDSILGEQEMPPFPPFGNIFAVLYEPPCAMNGLSYDLHYGNPVAATPDSFTMKLQLADESINPASVQWSHDSLLAFATAATITGPGISVDMMQDTVLQWNPTEQSLQFLKIHITWKPVGHYAIVTDAGPNGRIDPHGTTIVGYDSPITCTIVPDSGYTVESLLVDGESVGPVLQYTLQHVSADHTIMAIFAPVPPFTVEQSVQAKWNIISLPLLVADYSRSVLFPTALTGAFGFSDSYFSAQTLVPGYGYWMKFSSGQTMSHEGFSFTQTTIPVHAGWNLIGSLSVELPVSSIVTEPSEMVVNGVFGYHNGYAATDTIVPGNGYWIKVSEDGYIKLNVVSSTAPGAASH